MKNILYISFILLFISCNTKAQKLEIFQDSTTQLYGIKLNNKIITKASYIAIDKFTSCGIARGTHSTDGYHYINKKGKKLDIIPFVEGYEPDKFKEGYARFKLNNKIGFINECGIIKIEAKYELALPFKNGFSIVRKNFKEKKLTPEVIKFIGGKYGAIDQNGNLIIPFEYDYISLFDENKIAIAKKGDKKIKINSKGEVTK